MGTLDRRLDWRLVARCELLAAVPAWPVQVLHMLLFGRHPFLSPADMALGQAEQMVKLIENTVKGKLHVPEAAEVGSWGRQERAPDIYLNRACAVVVCFWSLVRRRHGFGAGRADGEAD